MSTLEEPLTGLPLIDRADRRRAYVLRCKRVGVRAEPWDQWVRRDAAQHGLVPARHDGQLAFDDHDRLLPE